MKWINYSVLFFSLLLLSSCNEATNDFDEESNITEIALDSSTLKSVLPPHADTIRVFLFGSFRHTENTESSFYMEVESPVNNGSASKEIHFERIPVNKDSKDVCVGIGIHALNTKEGGIVLSSGGTQALLKGGQSSNVEIELRQDLVNTVVSGLINPINLVATNEIVAILSAPIIEPPDKTKTLITIIEKGVASTKDVLLPDGNYLLYPTAIGINQSSQNEETTVYILNKDGFLLSIPIRKDVANTQLPFNVTSMFDTGIKDAPYYDIATSPNGDILALIDSNRSIFYLFKISEGIISHYKTITPRNRTNIPKSIHFNSDGSFISIINKNNSITIFKFEKNGILYEIGGINIVGVDEVKDIAISSDGFYAYLVTEIGINIVSLDSSITSVCRTSNNCLSLLPDIIEIPNPNSIVIPPSGVLAYVTSSVKQENSIVLLDVYKESPNLQLVRGKFEFESDFNPTKIIITPQGNKGYVIGKLLDGDSGNIYEIIIHAGNKQDNTSCQ